MLINHYVISNTLHSAHYYSVQLFFCQLYFCWFFCKHKLTFCFLRSSCLQMFCQIYVLKIPQYSLENICARSSFQWSCRPEGLQLCSNENPKQVFSCEFCDMFKNTFVTDFVYVQPFKSSLHIELIIFCFAFLFSISLKSVKRICKF